MTGVVAYRYMSMVYIRLYTCAEFRIGCTNTNYGVQSVGTIVRSWGLSTRHTVRALLHRETDGWSVSATGTTRAWLHGVSRRGQSVYQTALATCRRANGRSTHCIIGSSTNEALDCRNKSQMDRIALRISFGTALRWDKEISECIRNLGPKNE